MKLEVYSDGSATVKTKPGGYGYVIVVDGVKHSEGNGHIPFASNNDAELEGAIQGLVAALKLINSTIIQQNSNISTDITLVSDSEITLNWASGKYRFKQQDKIQKYNQLMALMKRLKADTRWVEGHSGDEHNERCDRLANEARLQNMPEKAKKSKKAREFKWNEPREIPFWSPDKSDKETLKTHTANEIKLDSLTRIVLELIELEESRKK